MLNRGLLRSWKPKVTDRIEPVVEPLRPRDHLPHTWSAFFARHGSLTPVQEQAIPFILAGRATLVSAPTASGKTEAVIAPLLERYLLGPTAAR
ncbi:MAG: DEAD/DEAH box helicase, partial [Anaerolineae bacterium]|nr:DEAD/DEAH box helicase [Anaerolineae bacterium]